MSRCKNCKIEVLDVTNTCPLCHSVLEQTEEMEAMYPNAIHQVQKMLFWSRIYLFCALLLEFFLIILDFYVESQIQWSILGGGILTYFYVLLRYAILGKSGYRVKTTITTIFTILLFISFDYATGFQGWSLDYVISSGIIFIDIGIIFFIIFNRRNWQSYIMWEIFMILCSFIPVLLYLLGWENNFYMIALAVSFSVFLFLGTLIIGGRKTKEELKRRFYL